MNETTGNFNIFIRIIQVGTYLFEEKYIEQYILPFQAPAVIITVSWEVCSQSINRDYAFWAKHK